MPGALVPVSESGLMRWLAVLAVLAAPFVFIAPALVLGRRSDDASERAARRRMRGDLPHVPRQARTFRDVTISEFHGAGA